MLTFQVTGVASAVKRLKGLSGKELERKSAQFLAKTARGVIVPAVKAEANFKGHGKSPGTLKRKITARKTRTRPGEMVAYSVRSRAPHNTLVNRGTKPHSIRVKRAKALAFGGIFASVVEHPGAKPNPFVARAARKIDPQSLAARLGKELLK